MTARPVPTFTAEPLPHLGAVIYDVAKVGAITVSFDSGGYHRGEGDGRCIEIHYGRWTGGYVGRTPLPDQPRVFGVEVGAGAVFDREKAIAHEPGDAAWWLVARRPDKDYLGQGSVPYRTRDRLADIVAALVQDFLTRPDADALLDAHKAHHAPTRLRGLTMDITRLREEIATRQAALDDALRAADEQVALIPADDAA